MKTMIALALTCHVRSLYNEIGCTHLSKVRQLVLQGVLGELEGDAQDLRCETAK